LNRSADGGRADIVVASSTPEIAHAASALAGAGRLSRYYVPIVTTQTQERLVARLPTPAVKPILRDLRRRQLPPGVPRDRAKQVGVGAELRRVAGTRLGLSSDVRMRLLHRQQAAFDRGVARQLSAADRGLVAVIGTAADSVGRARELGIETFMDSPIGHIAWIRDEMRREASLVPAYARTLQCHDFPDSVIARHERELALCDHLMVLSAHARESLISRGVDEAKMTMTPLGVDLELFRPAPRADDGVFRVVFVGQITQRKGISYLVEGFRKAALPNSELVFVGEVIGTPDPWISVPRVRHIPAMSRVDLPRIYAASDVYVLPSLAEGFPLTALEAMASGLPSILSEHTFAHDVVTDGRDGFVVPIRDAGAIAERLQALAADRTSRVDIGARARQRAEDFPWSRYGERVLELVDR
jgi:starch synthase